MVSGVFNERSGAGCIVAGFQPLCFKCPSSYTDELAGYLLIWVGVLGAAYVAAHREHLAIDLLVQRSSPERKFKLEMIISACIVIFSIFVLIIGGSWLAYTRFYCCR
jgi:TRAP-type C4-dicarboxylate transport system permease small subunit